MPRANSDAVSNIRSWVEQESSLFSLPRSLSMQGKVKSSLCWFAAAGNRLCLIIYTANSQNTWDDEAFQRQTASAIGNDTAYAMK